MIKIRLLAEPMAARTVSGLKIYRITLRKNTMIRDPEIQGNGCWHFEAFTGGTWTRCESAQAPPIKIESFE